MKQSKQLYGIRLIDVLEKRRLDQALNMKEFAVLAGLSYSMAREWFHIKGFPVFSGVVFWEDFVAWRQRHIGVTNCSNGVEKIQQSSQSSISDLPKKARRILLQT